MPIPEYIPVRFTEEEASYLSVRRVLRQQFTLRELLDMILAGTGKQPRRIQEILHAGTIVHNVYRYWWEGFALDDATLNSLLAEFPDPDPALPFRSEACAWVQFYDAAQPAPHTLTIEKQEAESRRWFRRRNFWDFLLELARAKNLAYLDYSYYHHADIYRAELDAADRALVAASTQRLAARPLRHRLGRGRQWVVLELACPRTCSPEPSRSSVQG